MKKFRLYWLDGKTEVVEGNDIKDAFRKAGYSNVAIRALDFHSQNESIEYKWDTDTQQWNPIPRKTQYYAGSIGGF